MIAGYSGDGGAATSAQLNYPWALSADIDGNVYIADYYNNRIRKVNSAGIITTLAGTGLGMTGEGGYSGDGGAASLAQLNHPSGLSADINGNVYIGDQNNHRIRIVNSAGIVSTFAGTGSQGYGGDGGAASLAQLNHPSGLSADISGNLYIADTSNNRIRKVNSAGIVTTLVGTGTAGYGGDGGAASLSQLNSPTELSADINGNVYIADWGNERIRKVNSAGIVTTFAGNGISGFNGDGVAATAAQLNQPWGVSADINGNVYIADQYNHRIRKVNSAGIITTFAGTGSWGYSGDGGAASLAQLKFPAGASADISGNVYIADLYSQRIRKVLSQSPTSSPTPLPTPLPTTTPTSLPSPLPSYPPTYQPSSRPTSSPSIKAQSLAPIPISQQQPSASVSVAQVSQYTSFCSLPLFFSSTLFSS